MPIALLYDTQSGHAGGEPLSKAIDDESAELAFVAWQLDMPAQRRRVIALSRKAA